MSGHKNLKFYNSYDIYCANIRHRARVRETMYAERSGCTIGAEYYIFLCDMHIANNFLLITHIQTLRAAPSHATMADVCTIAIDANMQIHAYDCIKWPLS